MRLIDADKLEPHGIYNGVEYRDVVYLDDIKKMPTVSKYKRILRCKDCKYWDYEVDNDVGFCVRTEDCDWNADDFCSRGERAE